MKPTRRRTDRSLASTGFPQTSASPSLGASNPVIFTQVILPALLPSLLSGAGLAFSRAIGEFGSVVLIGGAVPGETEVSSQWIRTLIENDRKQLFGSFCRACGYCMPCPAGIEINTCARMSLLLRRSPSHLQLTPEVQAKMMKIKDCLHCGHCMSKCPYGLNTPELLQRNLKDYEEVLAGKEILPGNF